MLLILFRPLDYTMVFFLHYDMLTTKSEIRYILHVSIPMYDCNVSREKLQFVYRKAINRIKSFSIEQPRKFESIFLFLAV